MEDVFSTLVNEDAASVADTRLAMLGDAKRGYVPLRRDFVQRKSGERASVLAQMVTGRKKIALDLLLTIHAFQPIKEPPPLTMYARMINATPAATSRAIEDLQELNLIKTATSSPSSKITLLRENGDGSAWKSPSAGKSDDGLGFFALPHDYWTDGVIDKLGLPGKAMLLIILRETQDPNKRPPWFVMAHARAKEWYGISERTAERGYRELREAGIMIERGYYVADPRHPRGKRYEIARALADPFSTSHRVALQKAARKATDSKVRNKGESKNELNN